MVIMVLMNKIVFEVDVNGLVSVLCVVWLSRVNRELKLMVLVIFLMFMTLFFCLCSNLN